MPIWTWLVDTFKKQGERSDDMLADMAMPNVSPDQILSAVLGFNTKDASDIAKGRDQYASFWIALEVARREIEQRHVLKLVHSALQARITALRRDKLPHHAEPLQRAADALGSLLSAECDHQWEVITRRVGDTQIHGCQCIKCGTIRPQSSEAGSII